jgi:hypothetical protein
MDKSQSLTNYLNTADLPAVSDDQLAVALQETAAESTTGGGGNVDYLSFSGKTGRYSLGRQQDEIDPQLLYLVEPQSFVAGWVCWKGSKPIDRIEWSIYQKHEQAVDQSNLEDHGPYRESAGEGWQALLGFGSIATDARHSLVKFSSTSKSGRNSIGDLMREIGLRAAAAEPSMPLIFFRSETFESNGQTNYKPILEVETWVTRDAVAAYIDGSLDIDELVAGQKPKKGRKKK